MWAIGVITYFLLCGYTPFDRDSTMEEMQAIINADYAFEPAVYWEGVSHEARDFVAQLLTIDPKARLTAAQALEHAWLAHGVQKKKEEQRDLLPDMKKAFNAKHKFKAAVNGIR
jgi:serine/threonine protein kinase